MNSEVVVPQATCVMLAHDAKRSNDIRDFRSGSK